MYYMCIVHVLHVHCTCTTCALYMYYMYYMYVYMYMPTHTPYHLLVQQKFCLDDGPPAPLLRVTIGSLSPAGRYAVEPIHGENNLHYLPRVLHSDGKPWVVAGRRRTPSPPASGVQRSDTKVVLLPRDELIDRFLDCGRFAFDGNRARWLERIRFSEHLVLNLVLSYCWIVRLPPAHVNQSLIDVHLDLCGLHASAHHTQG